MSAGLHLTPSTLRLNGMMFVPHTKKLSRCRTGSLTFRVRLHAYVPPEFDDGAKNLAQVVSKKSSVFFFGLNCIVRCQVNRNKKWDALNI